MHHSQPRQPSLCWILIHLYMIFRYAITFVGINIRNTEERVSIMAKGCIACRCKEYRKAVSGSIVVPLMGGPCVVCQF